MRLGMEDQFEHFKIHFVIPVIMSLRKGLMLKFRLVRNNQPSEMEIVIVKKIVDDVHIKAFFSRRNFCPFYFKASLQTVLNLLFSNPNGNISYLLRCTPYGTQDHYFLVIIFQVAAFIA